MTFPRDLLEQAELLARKELRKPKQASLRRAVSTAYYALFHLITQDSASAMSPKVPILLHRVVQRSFQHNQITKVCKGFVQANSTVIKNPNQGVPNVVAPVRAMIVFPLEPELITVMSAFVDIQEARHKADYDLTEQWNKLDVLNKLLDVRNAFSAWSKVQKTQNCAVFMTSLLVGKDWGR